MLETIALDITALHAPSQSSCTYQYTAVATVHAPCSVHAHNVSKMIGVS